LAYRISYPEPLSRTLAGNSPRIAHKLTDQQVAEMSLDKVSIADRLVVFPHEICPWMA